MSRKARIQSPTNYDHVISSYFTQKGLVEAKQITTNQVYLEELMQVNKLRGVENTEEEGTT